MKLYKEMGIVTQVFREKKSSSQFWIVTHRNPYLTGIKSCFLSGVNFISFKPRMYTLVMSDQSALSGWFRMSDGKFITDCDLKGILT